MRDIIHILESVENEKTDAGKIKILKEHSNNQTLKRILKLTYDPFIKYHIHSSNKELSNMLSDSTQELSVVEFNSLLDKIEFDLPKLNGSNRAVEFLKSVVHDTHKYDWLIGSIIHRNLYIGVNYKTLNKVYGKGFIREVPYMRCNLAKEMYLKKFGEKFYSQEKLDGQFFNIYIYPNKPTVFESRAGKFFNFMGVVEEKIEKVKHLIFQNSYVDKYIQNNQDGIVLTGEALVLKESSSDFLERTVGNGILRKFEIQDGANATESEGNRILFKVWDWIPTKNFELGEFKDLDYLDRFQELVSIQENIQNFLYGEDNIIQIPETIVCNSMEDAFQHYKDVLERGGEGTVVKDYSLPWKDHTSTLQLKLKVKFRVDLKIVGFTYGKPGSEFSDTVGSLICQSQDGLVKCKVSGLSSKHGPVTLRRDYIRDNFEKEYLNKIVEVEANDLLYTNGEWSLYLPQVKELREKATGDDLERIKEIKENAINFKI